MFLMAPEEMEGLDPYEKIQHAHAFMLSAFKDFMAEVEGDGRDDDEEYAESPMEEMDESAPVIAEGYAVTYPDEQPPMFKCDSEEFPGRLAYSYESLDADNPMQGFGMPLGIPIGVVVRSSDNQDRLIPLSAASEY